MNAIFSLRVIAFILSLALSHHCLSASGRIQFNWPLLAQNTQQVWRGTCRTLTANLHLRPICWWVCLSLSHLHRRKMIYAPQTGKHKDGGLRLYCLKQRHTTMHGLTQAWGVMCHEMKYEAGFLCAVTPAWRSVGVSACKYIFYRLIKAVISV